MTHENTLVHLYATVFPQSMNVEKKYTNLNVTEKSAIEKRNLSMRHEEGDSMLSDAAIYSELLNGDLYPSQLIKRDSSSSMLDDTIEQSHRQMNPTASLFEKRSISEAAYFPHTSIL